MTNLEYNKRFITGGSTENYFDENSVDSFVMKYEPVTIEQLFKTIIGENYNA